MVLVPVWLTAPPKSSRSLAESLRSKSSVAAASVPAPLTYSVFGVAVDQVQDGAGSQRQRGAAVDRIAAGAICQAEGCTAVDGDGRIAQRACRSPAAMHRR